MKKLLLLAVLVFAGWKGCQHFDGTDTAPASVMRMQASPAETVAQREPSRQPDQAAGFRCDGRQYCTQMRSRAEAEFFVRNCPGTKMDGDRDGEPCENDSRF